MTPFAALLDRLPTRAAERLAIAPLPGALPSLLIAQLAAAHERLILVVTIDSDEAMRIEAELRFLLAAQPQVPVLTFPDRETLPYDNFSPHQEIISQRLSLLYQLPQIRRGVLVIALPTLMQRLPPTHFLQGHHLQLHTGQTFSIERMRQQLDAAGYRAVENVYEHGEFAVRGAIFDLYPMGSSSPYRIELLDDEIESLRTFDAESQRTTARVDRVELLPAREFPLDGAGIATFRRRWYEFFDVTPKESPIFGDINQGIAPPGVEYYLPLFFDESATLFDYLATLSLVVTIGEPIRAAQQFWQQVGNRYDELRHDREKPLLPPAELFLPPDVLTERLNQFPQLQLHGTALGSGKAEIQHDGPALPDLTIDAKAKHPLTKVQTFLHNDVSRLLFVAESPGRAEALTELLKKAALRPVPSAGWEAFVTGEAPCAITVAPIERGLWLKEQGIALVTEAELFGHQLVQRRKKGRESDQSDWIFKNLAELSTGAAVVHIDHGVGRYQGLVTLSVDNQVSEFLMLEYAGGDKLYVPVASLQLISRYSGADDAHLPLHRLGSDQWGKAKRKAAEKIRDVAAELLDIHARRAARAGHACRLDDEDYRRFCADFPFEETPDQQRAIDAVIADMLAAKPMDRLICGDVGFGKTEVAMRAAFIALANHRQVAILVPTTLLAQQHFESFRDRFVDWPIRIELLSRFRSAREQQAALAGMADGRVDIIIGTHKLLQPEVKFKQLGLIIIDEEHRFGVRHKERLKALRAEVDILTMTATPIPRTLNMAMSGMRDISIITTAPARRLSVKTFVCRKSASIIREAVTREIQRGGQLFYLHNEVKSIDKAARELQELVPQARVIIAHGQMSERELEQAMADFQHRRFNVLVCSTIIETGIDIPNANTILIERADRFGLAQLHQLRGRVGRSHHQAYAYLLVPDREALTPDATKRLAAIQEADTLGAGFMLASHDLEIRGAGELLGEDQSGHIGEIGFTLYMEMLERAVATLREGKVYDPEQPLASGLDVNLRGVPALIPEEYLPDVHGRLVLYKRIASCRSDAALRELQVEMIDRFGLLPMQIRNLFAISALKLRCTALGIIRLEAGGSGGSLEFDVKTPIDPLTLVRLVQRDPARHQLRGATTLKFSWQQANPDAQQRLLEIEALLATLAGEMPSA